MTNQKGIGYIPLVLVILVLLLIALFSPVPQYQNQNSQCKPNATDCPKAGFRFGPSVWWQLRNNVFADGKPCGFLPVPGEWESSSCPIGFSCQNRDPGDDRGGICKKQH